MQSGRGQKGATNRNGNADPNHHKQHYAADQSHQPQRGQQRRRGGQRDAEQWDEPASKKGGWQEYKGATPPTQQTTKKHADEESKIAPEQKTVPAQAYEYKEHKTLQTLKLVVNSELGPQLFSLSCNNNSLAESLIKEEGYPEYPGAELAKFSPVEGQTLAVVTRDGIHLVDIQSKKECLFIQRKGIIALEWSPKESFLISCEKQKEGLKNLNVWDAKTGALVIDFEWKNTAKDGPNSVKFDVDEKFCARQVGKNIIDVYDSTNFKETKMQIKAKLPPLPKVNGEPQVDNRIDNSKFDGFLFCPIPVEVRNSSSASNYLMAWQNGEILSNEEDNGLVYVYDLNSNLQRPKFNIACPKAQNIQILPAPSGHAILVWSQNLNDSSGKSYYGEHNLQYVRIHKGKNRAFIAVFDNMIQDVKWTTNGQNFIVVSGQQPATATMYNADGQPHFEFGKRFRNTIRLCPFDQSLMIGGFGNLSKGEMDMWNLETLKEIGKGKSPCATRIDWSACGRYMLTCTLYERLKVDNGFQIFRANGSKVLEKPCTFNELYSAQWQPHEAGVLSKPNIDKLRKEDQKSNDQPAKPKRIFKFGGKGGDNSAFQQMMRQQMANDKPGDKAPKKVDATHYKELQAQQTAKAQESISQQNNTAACAQSNPSTKQEASSETGGPLKSQKAAGGGQNWRLGKFHDDDDDNQYFSEQAKVEADLDATPLKIEVQTQSKHSKRRNKKKAAQIICDADPSLDDL